MAWPLEHIRRARHTVQADILASVVVFLVALPLCMGIAIASGVPAAAGLITGVVGGLVVAIFQGSPLQVSGPAAGLAVIVWQLVETHGLPALGVIVLGAGVVQIVAALLKGGRWFRAVPPSVIYGMLAGIGVLIFASQFHVMVDDRPKGSGIANLVTVPLALWKAVASSSSLPHREAALTGVVTILVVLAWTRVPGRLRVIPSPLMGVVVATALANLLSFPIAYVTVPESLFSAVSLPNAETLRLLLSPSLWGAVLAMAAIASAETLLCASAVDRMHWGPRTQYNRELLAQGIGNSLCGLFGALPMTGVIVRSTANVQAGARTRLSAFLHGAWILILVVALPQVLRLIPVASLAAILVYTGYKLVNPATVRSLARYGRSEVAIYCITVIAIVATDLLKGVLVGFALAIAKLLYRMSNLDISVEDLPDGRRTIVHLRGSATFFRLADIAETLERIPPQREVHIRFEDLDHLDHATLELLTTWGKQHSSSGGSVIVDWDELEERYHANRRTQANGSAGELPAGPLRAPDSRADDGR